MTQPRVLVIGGGLAGLSATMRLAELGVHVDLVSHCRADAAARAETLLQIVCKTHESNVSTEHHDHQG